METLITVGCGDAIVLRGNMAVIANTLIWFLDIFQTSNQTGPAGPNQERKNDILLFAAVLLGETRRSGRL